MSDLVAEKSNDDDIILPESLIVKRSALSQEPDLGPGAREGRSGYDQVHLKRQVPGDAGDQDRFPTIVDHAIAPKGPRTHAMSPPLLG